MSAPPAPNNLSSTSRAFQTTLNWSAVDGDTYNIYWASVQGGPYKLLVSGVINTYYVDTGLINGQTYYYVVTAVKNGVESVFSNETATVVPLVAYTYVIEHGNIASLPTTINRWNGSAYQLKFVFNPDWSNEKEYGQCYCIWEKEVIST